MSHPTDRPPLASGRPSILGVLLAALVLGLLAPTLAVACVGKAPPPRCAKSLVLAQAAPPVLLIPAGGTFDVPVTVYYSMFDFPPGSGICPASPTSIDVDLTVTCTPAGDGVGTLIAAPLSLGFNEYQISVTLPAGPPRLCSVDGVATLAFGDGMELTATSDSLLCVGDPALGNPDLPRLDLELTSGDAISRVHPGDQSAFVYRVTNNDPTNSFTGTFGVESFNTSRQPGASGPMPFGTGPFAISDPGLGDNFPIGLPDDLVDGCLPLPPDPTLPILPVLEEPIVLPPGEFFEFDLFMRPWGMCADGSCSRGKVVVDGTFADSSDGKACSGFVSAADITVPPTFQWPDAGQNAIFELPLDPSLGVMPLVGMVEPQLPVGLELIPQQPQLAINGGPPLPLQPQMFAGPMDPERGRLQLQFDDPQGLMPVDQFFDLTFQLQVQPLPGTQPPIEPEIVSMDLVSGAPSGFEQTDPFGAGLIGIRLPGEPDFAGFGQLTMQLSGLAVDDLGDGQQVLFDLVQMQPAPGGLAIEVLARGFFAAGGGSEILDLQIFVDPRIHFSQLVELPCPGCEIFNDDFETGDLTGWSNSN